MYASRIWWHRDGRSWRVPWENETCGQHDDLNVHLVTGWFRCDCAGTGKRFRFNVEIENDAARSAMIWDCQKPAGMGKFQRDTFLAYGNAHDCINKMHDFTIVKTESIDGTPFSDRMLMPYIQTIQIRRVRPTVRI